MKKIGAVLLAAGTALSAVSAQAAPMFSVSAGQTTSQPVDLIHHKPGHYGGPPHKRGYDVYRYGGNRYNAAPRYGYYNGYEGYRYRRDGYRRHSDGWWHPLAAFGTGVIIGGAIASPPRRVYSNVPSSHVEWCYDRYRSYRAYDNSFQPYYGPRQECVSPYY
ncbi:BA14K family protein [Ensifer adhaerens]|uniref:BA14K family protein n=1 Tax=Ensifer adhaerens TaxID=106592 RepID=UPI000FDB2F25|nr:BA14K family protein [Ensifer adhaerens]MDF8356807.1 BA14K family protein [Ensifer adhaerens]THA57766.1 BA14K family protein [Ensifer adhaerens]